MRKSKPSTFKNFHLLHDLILIGLSLSIGLVSSFVFFDFVLLRNHLFDKANAAQHSAAENPNPTSQVFYPSSKDISPSLFRFELGLEKSKTAYGALGQNAIEVIKFHINSDENGYLKKLILHVGGFSKPYDVSSMELYQGKKLIKTVPVFDGKAVFEELGLPLQKKFHTIFEVKAKISEQANVGDRIQIGFQNSSDLTVQGENENEIEPSSVFPLWAQAISVIGEKK